MMHWTKLASKPFKSCTTLTSKILVQNPIILQQYRCFQSKNFYAVLGLKPKATDEEIKQAYYSLSKKYHPDLNYGNKEAESKILEINAAFEVLGNKEDKKKYDSKLFPEIWEKQSSIYEQKETGPDPQSFIFRRTMKAQPPSSFEQFLKHQRGQMKRKHRHDVQKRLFNKGQSSQKLSKMGF